MCELARNSCLQSGFEMQVKRHWLGSNWFLLGVAGNEIHKSNVPDLRIEYRYQTLQEERLMVRFLLKFLSQSSTQPNRFSSSLQVSQSAIPPAPSVVPSKAPLPSPPMTFGGASGSADVVGAAAMSSGPSL